MIRQRKAAARLRHSVTTLSSPYVHTLKCNTLNPGSVDSAVLRRRDAEAWLQGCNEILIHSANT